MISIKSTLVRQLAKELRQYADSFYYYNASDLVNEARINSDLDESYNENEDFWHDVLSEAWIDCSLRYFEGNYTLIFGDSQYISDHRGHWGYCSINLAMGEHDYPVLIQDAISEIVESLMQYHSNLDKPVKEYTLQEIKQQFIDAGIIAA